MARTIQLPNLDAAEPAVSGFELSRFVDGELSAERRAHIDALLQSDAALKARHDAIVSERRAEDGALKLDVPLPRFLDTHAVKTKSPLASLLKRLRMPMGFGALAASAAAVFLMVRMPADDRPSYDGLKGGARIGFFVKGDGDARPGAAGETLHEGDRIQFAVRDDGDKDVMVVVGIDGRGQVSMYAAEALADGRSKGPPMGSEPRLLPSSVVLDDSTGAERFFVVYADGELSSVQRAVEDAARKLVGQDLGSASKLPLDDAFAQSSVHIVKVPAR
jgi:hypothetical protein